ncbi:MAG: NAD(P)/FAD-dependent oxidoreductase [Candidatus Korarchaeota archaeon]
MKDVIVVGAGVGGAPLAAWLSKKGLDVVLIDAKPQEKIGDKVCGDAIGGHHFESTGIPPPSGEELLQTVKGIRIFSPSKKVVFHVVVEDLAGYMVNRLKFGQRLLHMALDNGAELMPDTKVSGPIVKNGTVVGVVTSRGEINAKVTVDASGSAAVIRSRLPPEMYGNDNVLPTDLIAAYREIIKYKLPESEYADIYMTVKYAPGGYVWEFPHGDETNVGLGVQMGKNYENPKALYKRYIETRPFASAKVEDAGGGVVPTRHLLWSLVGNGVVYVGDAACQVNPVHGGGIGITMEGALIASKHIPVAIEKDDTSQRGLWGYTLEFNRVFGGKIGSLDIFRRFLQKVSDDELNYGMENKLLKEEDVLKASMGEKLKLSIGDKATRFFKGIGKLGFLRALSKTAKIMEKVKKLYAAYPETPDKLQEWISRVKPLFDEADRLEW